jgi:hypothetical protein
MKRILPEITTGKQLEISKKYILGEVRKSPTEVISSSQVEYGNLEKL